jgi:hypothetical protein
VEEVDRNHLEDRSDVMPSQQIQEAVDRIHQSILVLHSDSSALKDAEVVEGRHAEDVEVVVVADRTFPHLQVEVHT